MDLKSEFLFEYLKKHIAEEGSLIVKKIKAIFHFYVSKYAGTAPTCFTINLKEGNGILLIIIGKIKGSVSKGKEGKADASIIIADSDLCDLAAGKLKATKAILNVV